MSNKNKIKANLPIILGTAGVLAGIGLILSENWFLGIFGSMASAAIAYKGFQDLKQAKNEGTAPDE